jgi:hypothetical protein
MNQNKYNRAGGNTMKKILTREEQAQPLSATKRFLWLIFLVPATHAKLLIKSTKA